MLNAPATPAVLARRLRDLGATTLMMLDAGQARDAIVDYLCQQAVCERANGKLLKFFQYYEAVYGVDLNGQKVKPKAVSASRATAPIGS